MARASQPLQYWRAFACLQHVKFFVSGLQNSYLQIFWCKDNISVSGDCKSLLLTVQCDLLGTVWKVSLFLCWKNTKVVSNTDILPDKLFKWRHGWWSQWYATKVIVNKIQALLNGIRTRGVGDTGALLYLLSYQANWALVALWVRSIPVDDEECKWIYGVSYTHLQNASPYNQALFHMQRRTCESAGRVV